MTSTEIQAAVKANQVTLAATLQILDAGPAKLVTPADTEVFHDAAGNVIPPRATGDGTIHNAIYIGNLVVGELADGSCDTINLFATLKGNQVVVVMIQFYSSKRDDQRLAVLQKPDTFNIPVSGITARLGTRPYFQDGTGTTGEELTTIVDIQNKLITGLGYDIGINTDLAIYNANKNVHGEDQDRLEESNLLYEAGLVIDSFSEAVATINSLVANGLTNGTAILTVSEVQKLSSTTTLPTGLVGIAPELITSGN